MDDVPLLFFSFLSFFFFWRWRTVLLPWILSDGFYFVSSCCYDTLSSIFSFRTMVCCWRPLDRYVNVVGYYQLFSCSASWSSSYCMILRRVLLDRSLLYLLLLMDISILKLRCRYFSIRYDLIGCRPCSLDVIVSKVPKYRDRCVVGNTITVGRAWGYEYNCCWGCPCCQSGWRPRLSL